MRALLLLPVALFMMVSLVLLTSPIAHAGGSWPIIHWGINMIYPNENNGNPWGPVGENATVQGANFTAKTGLRLVVSPGDSNSDPSVCQQSLLTIVVGTVTTDSTGSFTLNFDWPGAAGKVNQGYSICALLESDNSLASSHDDGPFTVLTSSPPVISLSASSVTAGGTVTVSGQNWVPPQEVWINIAGCAACEPGNTEVKNVNTYSVGLNSGTFSTVITIPASTKSGNYVVDALTAKGMEAYYTTGVKHLGITAAQAAVTPTPTLTASPSATVQPSATATATNLTSSSGPSNTGGNSENPTLIFLLLLGALLLFVVAALVILMMRSSRKRTKHDMQPSPPNGSNGQYIPPGQLAQFSATGSSPGNYPQQFGQPVQQPGGYPQQFGQPVPGSYPQQYEQPMHVPGSYPQQYEQPMHVPGSYPQQFGQPVQQPGSSPGNYPQQFGQPVQVPGSYSQQFGQPVQQRPGNGFTPPYAQPTEAYTPANNYAQRPLTYAPTCPNCSRPLAPNALNCGTCGMPVELMRL